MSTTWTMPFDACTVAMIVASLIFTLPSFTWTVAFAPLAIASTMPSVRAFC